MSHDVPVREHLDRVRRVRTAACSKCGARKGQPCRSPNGSALSAHHAARWAALYRREARQS